MPTIHLSVPEKVYDELRRKAEGMGISITSLVKIAIKECIINNGMPRREAVGSDNEEAVEALAKKVDSLERMVKLQVMRLKGKQKELEDFLQYVLERLEMIEDMLSSQRRPTVLAGDEEG